MVYVQQFFGQAASLFVNLFAHPDWHNLLDIAILAVLIYQLMKVIVRTRANSLLKGIGVILVMAWLAEVLQISAVSWLLEQLISTGFLMLIILFQPELRRGLDQIGRSGWMRKVFDTAKGEKKDKKGDPRVAELVRALLNMSRKKIGALIVMERRTHLGDVVDSGTTIDAEISDPLIENIFEPNTPLHDGAMVIRNGRIAAAACILPLSEDYTISRDLGTRHRAGIGLTESSDAVVLIVSEETGTISMARDGKLTRYLDAKALHILLTEMFSSESESMPSLFAGLFERSARKQEGDDEE